MFRFGQCFPLETGQTAIKEQRFPAEFIWDCTNSDSSHGWEHIDDYGAGMVKNLVIRTIRCLSGIVANVLLCLSAVNGQSAVRQMQEVTYSVFVPVTYSHESLYPYEGSRSGFDARKLEEDLQATISIQTAKQKAELNWANLRMEANSDLRHSFLDRLIELCSTPGELKLRYDELFRPGLDAAYWRSCVSTKPADSGIEESAVARFNFCKMSFGDADSRTVTANIELQAIRHFSTLSVDRRKYFSNLLNRYQITDTESLTYTESRDAVEREFGESSLFCSVSSCSMRNH